MDLTRFHRPLGTTGLRVSPIGLGTVKFGRNQSVAYPNPFDLPDDGAVVRLLTEAQSLGINLLDSAPAYGTSEARLGKLLPDRKDWIICSKVGEAWDTSGSRFDFSPEGIRVSVARSLDHLRTDVLDIVLVHSDGGNIEQQPEAALGALAELKAQGLARAIGFSAKTAAGVQRSAALADVLMATYTPAEPDVLAAADAAMQAGVGILAKKVLQSGHTPTANALALPLSNPGLGAVVIGTINPTHLHQNVPRAIRLLESR